jgi:hypothetical protein
MHLPMPTEPLDIPAAWVGRDIQEKPELWSYEFTQRDIDELLAATTRVTELGLDLARINPRTFLLARLGPTLKAVALHLSQGVGVMLLRGLPIADLPIDVVEKMYFGLSTHLGIPVAQNSKGDLLGNVRDEGASYGRTVRAYQSNVPLTYHNDSTDVVGLACVRPAKSGGLSRIISAVTLHNTLMREAPDALQTLYDEPSYFSWKGEEPAGQHPYYWARIFSYYQGQLTTCYSNRLILETQKHYADVPPMSDAHRAALERVEEIALRPEMCLDMDFKPGDIQFLNNFHVWHSRTGFTDHEDQALRRHLLRVWLAEYSPRQVSVASTNRTETLAEHGHLPRRRVFDVAAFAEQG